MSLFQAGLGLLDGVGQIRVFTPRDAYDISGHSWMHFVESPPMHGAA